ncbi:YHYH protein [uncultured Roseibium sp.]|uniref:YHYH protein n=1 Tax=uncultured Roseibium sp. TaxID=1936171 RepID=UPI00321722C1
MRKTLAVLGTVLTTAAQAHDGSHKLAGEHPVEEKSLSESVWDLMIPPADAAATITVEGAYRYIHANGYPIKAPGQFPNSGNPNRISKKNYQLRVPVNPKKTGRATPTGPAVFGIAVNGVVMDPGTAEFWQNDRRSGWNYEAMGGACRLGLDKFNAHVQPDGTYHYHGIPTGVLASEGGKSVPALLGYAADGFPIYGPYGYSDPKRPSAMTKLKSSYVIRSGTRPDGPGGSYDGKFTQDWTYAEGRGDLDHCNGRFAVTPEYPKGTYQYVLTDTFPFIPRCWMGTPDRSFMRLKGRGGPGGRPGPQAGGPPPQGGGLFGQRPGAGQGPGFGPGQGSGRGPRAGGPGGHSPCSGT